MPVDQPDPLGVVVNQDPGGWAFANLAKDLSAALWVDISNEPIGGSYVLNLESPTVPHRSFIPDTSLLIASDKRHQAELFADACVPTPATYLVDTLDAIASLPNPNGHHWVLKYPTGCGAGGHRMADRTTKLPDGWPRPLVVQEFIDLPTPEVYRLYSANGELFGWNVRRFPDGADGGPWVAHATGARYTLLDVAPAEAEAAAAAALDAVGLLSRFGCADLLHGPNGWVVLEVGTDGVYNYVDREVPEPLRTNLDKAMAQSFWAWLDEPAPWEPGQWHPRPANHTESHE